MVVTNTLIFFLSGGREEREKQGHKYMFEL